MKITICLLVTVLVVSIEALPAEHARSKRGFRMGAADRFSHGFGKRADTTENLQDENLLMTVEELAELIARSPKLSESFVSRYVDTNGDGIISRDELFAGKE